MLNLHRITLLTALWLPAACLSAAQPTKVLLIGNSYTAGARPGIELFLAGADVKFQTSYITPGGRRLVQHAKNDQTLKKIRQGGWDYVVFQEQSQVPSLPAMKDQFLQSGAELHEVAKTTGAKTLLYSTWGRRDGDKQNPKLNPDYETMQQRLDASYKELAKRTGATVVPVGAAWMRVKQQAPGLFAKLYAADGSHPSRHGSFLIGAVFYKVLTGKPPTMPKRLPPGVSRTEAATLLSAAQ